jgi:hypothetical protein
MQNSHPSTKSEQMENGSPNHEATHRIMALPPPKIPIGGPNPVHFAPTVSEIITDPLTQISLEYWAPNSPKQLKPFDPQIIEMIYKQELVEKSYNVSRIMLLELSRYLEQYIIFSTIFSSI